MSQLSPNEYAAKYGMCGGTVVPGFAADILAHCQRPEHEGSCKLDQDLINGNPLPGPPGYPEIGGVVLSGVPSVRGAWRVKDAPQVEIDRIQAALIEQFQSPPANPLLPPLEVSDYTRQSVCNNVFDANGLDGRRLLFAAGHAPGSVRRIGFTCFTSLEEATAWAQLQPGVSPSAEPVWWRQPVTPLLEAGECLDADDSVELKLSDVAIACHVTQRTVGGGGYTWACHHGRFDRPQLGPGGFWLVRTLSYEAKMRRGGAFGISCHLYERDDPTRMWVGTLCHITRNGMFWNSTAKVHPPVPYPEL